MAQPSRVTPIDPSKRELKTNDTPLVAPREYHNPLEGLSHPVVVGTLLASGEVMAFLGIFFGLRLTLAGLYVISIILLATRIWSESKNTHQLLDGEYAWIVRLLVVIVGFTFVEIGMTMSLSWQGYATQVFGFSIPLAYTTLLLYLKKKAEVS
ncbi:MAG: hypothetical protein AAB400_01570 [Patescibacteria group bacterium]